ncbi:MAG: alpha/beta hydrolase [Candidatus Sericytochromatia bacterium]
MPFTRKFRPIWLFLPAFALSLGYLYLLKVHVEAVTYFRETPASWNKLKSSQCLRWRKKFIFGDLRPQSKDPFQPLEDSCQEALKYPAQSYFASNQRGQKIHFLRYPTAKKEAKAPILLFVHGIAANAVTGLKFYPIAQRLGFELIIMELSNHGQSDDNGQGASYGCREAEDLLAVLRVLQQQDPRRPVLIYGTSMGAMTVANAAPALQAFRSQVRGVVLENPQSSLRDIVGVYAQKMGIPDFHTDLVVRLTGLRVGVDYAACAPAKRVQQLTIPALVMVSEKDYMVPVWMVEKVFRQIPTQTPRRYKRYPYGEHSAIWNGQPEVFEKDLQAFWLASLMDRPKLESSSTFQSSPTQ